MPALVPTRQEPTRGFNGCARGLQRYRCRDCSCTFNALTGTPLAQLRHRDRWYEQGRVLIYGLSVTMAAEQLQVARSTAFRWWHCFLQLPQHVKAAKLEGIVEADETGWLKSCKGQRRRRRSQQRLARRRGGRAKTRGLSDEYDVVLVMRDRSGGCADQIARAQGAAHLAAVLQPKLAAEAVLCTDGSMALAAAASHIGVEHRAVNINADHSRLKGWMRRFNGVASSYLPSYLGWFHALHRLPINPNTSLALIALVIGV